MLTTDQKGAIAEACIATAAIKLGIGVYRPLVEGGRYDLIFDAGDRLLRVQCKWAQRLGGVVIVRCYSSRRTRGGMLNRTYSADDIDLVAAFCADLDRCYFLPPATFEGRRQVHLRLSPSRNNQRVRVNWADHYTLESLHLLPSLGP